MFSKAHFAPLLELLYLSLIASITFISGAIYLNCPIDLDLVITFALLVFGIYAINRYTDVEDMINDPEKNSFFINNKIYLYITITLFIFSIGLLILKEKLTLYHIVLLLLGISYSVKVIPFINKKHQVVFKRLKDLPFAKSLIVSLLLGTAFFAISMSVYSNLIINNFEIITIMISFTLGIFMNTNFADLRDLKGDKAVGVPTIPVIFGRKNTYLGTMIIPGIIWSAASVYFLISNMISMPLFTLFALNLLFPLLYISLYNYKDSFKKYVQPVSDSCVLIYAVGLVVISQI